MFKNRIKELRMMKASEIADHPQNWRRHPAAQQKALRNAMERIGFADAVLAYETPEGLRLVDGHLRKSISGDQEIPVLITDLNEQEARAVLASLDPLAMMAETDEDMLRKLLDGMDDFGGLDDLLDAVRDQAGIENESEPQEAPEAQIDRAEELNEKWQVQRGDLWQIGEHRLLCGDSTSAEDVARVMGGEKAELMVTDPPYGVSYADKNAFLNSIDKGNCVQSPIENDHHTVQEMADLWLDCFTVARQYANSNCSYYVASPQGGELMMMMMIERAGWQLKHTIIWVKNNHVLGRADYNYKHEPLIYGWNKTHTFYGAGQFKTSVWEIAKPLQSKDHPTMKPVELFAECVLNSSAKTQLIYDPFGGSGTTMIACEQLQRKCRMIEIEPKYCAVILERMSQMGLTPELIEG